MTPPQVEDLKASLSRTISTRKLSIPVDDADVAEQIDKAYAADKGSAITSAPKMLLLAKKIISIDINGQYKEDVFALYKLHAEKGVNAESMFLLANCYHEGYGCKQNQAEALKWYKAAAAKGNRKAISKLQELNS